MAISRNTSAAANSSGAQTPAQLLTIPAGVLAGDVMLLAVEAFNSTTVTPTIVSTSTAFTQIGASQASGSNSGFTGNGSIWLAIAGAGDAGKIITASGATCFWAMSMVAYTGADNTTPIDVSGGTAVANNTVTDVVCPSLVTGVSGDWAVFLCPFGTLGLPVTGPAGATQVINNNASGVGTAIFDSNGSVGGSGTSIGGGQFAASSTCWWTAFTVGLAPAAGIPPVSASGGLAGAAAAMSGTARETYMASGGLQGAAAGLGGTAQVFALAASGGLAGAPGGMRGVASNGQATGGPVLQTPGDDARHRMRRRFRRQRGGW